MHAEKKTAMLLKCIIVNSKMVDKKNTHTLRHITTTTTKERWKKKGIKLSARAERSTPIFFSKPSNLVSIPLNLTSSLLIVIITKRCTEKKAID